MRKLLSALAIMLLPIASIPAAAQEIRLGILPRLSPAELTTMFSPLAEYLSRQAGQKVTLVLLKDFAEFKQHVREGQLEIAFSNPLIYVELKRGLDLGPLAVATEKKGGAMFRGILITRQDSGIQSVADVKGRRLVFVDKDSLGGYLSQLLYLRKQGLEPTRDFKMLPFAKKHDNVTLAVLSRFADVGGIREDDLDKMTSKADLADIKVLAQTDMFPNWPLYALPRTSSAVREKIKAALLALDKGDAVLEAAQLTGFAPITDREYDSVREAARAGGDL